MTAQPVRNGPIRPGGPLTVPSGIWTKTAPFAMTARADATCWSIADAAAPHRQQATDPVDEPLAPARRERRRRAAEEPGARLGRDRVHDDERIHPAAMRRGDAGGSRRPGRCSWPEVRIWNRKTTKMTNRATSRRSRYRSDAFASGGRPSQREALDRRRRAAAAIASGEMRPGGGRRRRPIRAERPARSCQDGPAAGVAVVGSDVGGSARVGSSAGLASSVIGHVLVVDGFHRPRSAVASSSSASTRPRRRRLRRRLVLVVVVVVVARRRRRHRRPRQSPVERPPEGAPRRPPRAASAGRRRDARAGGARARITSDRDDEQHRHDLRGRDPEERPVVRRGASRAAKRTRPYQMKKISSRSPGRSRARSVEAEPDQEHRAEDPGDRLVQEQRVEAVVASGNSVPHG